MKNYEFWEILLYFDTILKEIKYLSLDVMKF